MRNKAASLLLAITLICLSPSHLLALETSAPDSVALSATLNPNDPCFAGCLPYEVPWHFEATGAAKAWEVTNGSDDVVIAVVDNGIDDQHPDLLGKITRVPGCGLGQTSQYSTSHGTFIAGLIGASANNSIATTGLDWNAQILDVRVMNGSQGSTSDIAAGIKCAAANGADIITLSFVQQGSQISPTLQEAISEAQASGALVIAAAGNDGYERQRFPAAAEGVLSVGAIGQSLDIASFSTRGNWIDLMAPGENLLSLGSGQSNGVRLGQGSSFAAPFVAAGASLVKARFPYFDANQISNRLVRTAKTHASPVTGAQYRILDIEQAVKQPYRSHWQVTETGQVVALGESEHFGDLTGSPLTRDVTAIAADFTGLGYWLAQTNGAVTAFGDAQDFGDLSTMTLNKPIVDMASTPSGNGYWLVASDGGIFSFGDAQFHGSTGAMTLNKPIVDMASTPSGNGYWLVASDGGIFSFGDAQFHGSTGAMTLNKPITSVVQTHLGYDLVAEDGGVFNFNSPFLGSAASQNVKSSIVDATSRVSRW